MSAIIGRERALNTEIHAIDQYAAFSPGEHYLPLFLSMVGISERSEASRYTVLDAGCGSGKGSLALKAAGFRVITCDLTDGDLRVEEARALPFHPNICLWDHLPTKLAYLGLGNKADYVYCTDVLEHIPTEFTMLTIARLIEVARRGLFLSISLVPDQFGVWVGQHLHKTVQPFTWWRDNITAAGGQVMECRDLGTAGVYLVRSR